MTCKYFGKGKTYMFGIFTQLPNKRSENEKYVQIIVDYIGHIQIVMYLIQVL